MLSVKDNTSLSLIIYRLSDTTAVSEEKPMLALREGGQEKNPMRTRLRTESKDRKNWVKNIKY